MSGEPSYIELARRMARIHVGIIESMERAREEPAEEAAIWGHSDEIQEEAFRHLAAWYPGLVDLWIERNKESLRILAGISPPDPSLRGRWRREVSLEQRPRPAPVLHQIAPAS